MIKSKILFSFLCFGISIPLLGQPGLINNPRPFNARFSVELSELKEYFSIPGLAAVVSKNGQIVFENYLGVDDLQTEVEVDSLTSFPIASLTKLFSATLIMKLVEEGKLSLETPVNELLQKSQLKNSVQIKHLLSHTSQGNVGEQFYYSYRFGLLSQIIEEVSGKSFSTLMEDEIFKPLSLQNTFLLEDSAQLSNKAPKFASPYILDDGVQEGFVDFGYSAAAGIVSTSRDLIRFLNALNGDKLLGENFTSQMFRPFKNNLPYGYGVFVQEINGLKIIWSYGQYDCYSGLLIKVPNRGLDLVLLANNNLMSDPARLIMGELQSSLFALSFLKNYVFDFLGMDLIENPDSVFLTDHPGDFYRHKVLAQALAESFLARFETQRMETSATLIERTFDQYPNYLEYADINLLHNLSFLKDVAFYMDLGEFNRFDTQIEEIGEKLLKEDRNNPYLHSYLGTYYDRKGKMEKARYHFETILNLENFSPNWYTQEAKNWLETHK